jgi:SPP1 gp7 family putative phage head morphogenesis protein
MDTAQRNISLDVYNNYDPTKTTVLRNLWAKDMKRRFNELIIVIVEAVVTLDCFGLNNPAFTTNQVVPPGNRAFAFMRDPEKIDAFMTWLKRQEEKGILTTSQFQQIGSAINGAWTNIYVADSYKRGLLRARQELQKAGVPSIEATGGIDASMSTPFHMDRVGVLFTRVFTELVGITATMDTTISRILAQGMIDGDGPKVIARKMKAAIDGTGETLAITDKLGRFIPAQRRAMMLARTETIRAYHLAAIQEYRNWGVEGVHVMAEWMTSEDEKVCNICREFEGKIFTLDEIEPMIPAHPHCRCVAIPYLEELKKFYGK